MMILTVMSVEANKHYRTIQIMGASEHNSKKWIRVWVIDSC